MKRRKLALYYKKKINKYLNNIKIPFTKYIGNFLSYHIFPIILPKNINRKKLYKFLIKNGIETTIHYTPINDFTFYKKKMKLKNLDEISKRLISLPLYPKLKQKLTILFQK